MPELPEVNTFKIYFDTTALQQPIQNVEVHDEKIFRNMDGKVFEKRLKGRTFINSHRQGKYLFGALDNGHSVLFHFGMTGDFVYYQEMEDRPRFERFVFHFKDGGKLGFDCPRKFARILYLEDWKAYVKEQQLGPDALQAKQPSFMENAQGKKTTIKAFLLDQSNIAGVGNLYADEICYQAKIHPASRMDQLSEAQLTLIFTKMQRILKDAVERSPHYKQYPENWYWQWREEGKTGPMGTVERTKVAGRTTYFWNPGQLLVK